MARESSENVATLSSTVQLCMPTGNVLEEPELVTPRYYGQMLGVHSRAVSM